jgi:hypothetical protein
LSWGFLAFQADIIFGQEEQVTVFGRFDYASKLVNNVTQSPFAIYEGAGREDVPPSERRIPDGTSES